MWGFISCIDHSHENDFKKWCSPFRLYKDTELNMLGCIIVCILYFCINPIYVICIYVYKLLCIGKRK